MRANVELRTSHVELLPLPQHPSKTGTGVVYVRVLLFARFLFAVRLTLFGASGLPCTSHWTYIIVPPTTTGTLPRDRMSSMAS